MEKHIIEALNQAFANKDFTVENQSHLHAGHAGDDGSGESHFKIKISEACFDTTNRVARERMVHKALGGIMNKIHALSVEVIANH